MNNDNLKPRLLGFGLAVIAALFLLWIFCFKTGPIFKDRVFTVTHYSASGAILGEWTNARNAKHGPGWCDFDSADGKRVRILGSCRVEEQ